MARNCVLSSSNILTRSALVANLGSGGRGASPACSLRVPITSPKPGSCARCLASSPSVRDFMCGRQSLLPLGTRSSMRRVVDSSDSRSGNRRANGVFCLLGLLDLLAALTDFFFDLLDRFDLPEDLERADALAMSDFD